MLTPAGAGVETPQAGIAIGTLIAPPPEEAPITKEPGSIFIHALRGVAETPDTSSAAEKVIPTPEAPDAAL